MSKKDQPNPDGLIVTCLQCGRDTKSKWALCNQCGPRAPGGFMNNSRNHETKDRKQNPYYHIK
jgi:hypothetical protein